MNRSVSTAAIVLAALAGISGNASAEGPFSLSSTTFKDGTIVPAQISNVSQRGPNCTGENLSPQLSWSGAPEGTKSFALTMIDPEGRGGTGVYHFVAYGIPAQVTSFAEGELSTASERFVGGKSTMGIGTYSGPCAPPGPPHHYTFIAIATDLDPKELPPGLTIPELWAKLPGHTKASAGLVGLYAKP